MVYNFFDKGASVGPIKIMPNMELAEELHKPITRKSEKWKVHSFLNNIWGVDLAGMQLLSKYNKGIRFLLGVIDI